MHNQVSVEKAIQKGRLTIIYAMLLFLIGCPIVSIIIFNNYEHKIIEQLWFPIGMFIGLIIGFVLMKIYWNYASIKWQFWAFENVRNVNELKRKAIENKLISENNFILVKKFKNRNYERHKRIGRIRKNFEEKDTYYDDLTVPKEMVINIPRSSNLIIALASLFFVGISIKAYLSNSAKLHVAFILFAVGVFFLVLVINGMRDKQPQLILNSNGIKLYKIDFISWNEINDIYVEKELGGNSAAHYLIIDSAMNKILKFQINGLDKKPDDIEKVIQIYKKRFEKILLN
jgi:hypothetical protein